MATLASGSIILSAVNDAYTVSLTPNSCVVNADYNGANPQLDNAYTVISVQQGDIPVEFDIDLLSLSNEHIGFDIQDLGLKKKISLRSFPPDLVSGSLEFNIRVRTGFTTTVSFQFAVVRAATMLDWILDWENNKTKIGDTYLITPKIFVGRKIVNNDTSSLSGIYIGPDSTNGDGIYGYKEGEEIFHINKDGGSIGGWYIASDGIVSQDDVFQILSEGSIQVLNDDGDAIWGIYKSGEATFANGNVQMHADGSASFAGTITARSGKIGGWNIEGTYLSADNIVLNAANHYIDVYRSPKTNTTSHLSWLREVGGLSMYYSTDNSYGLLCYLPKSAGGVERRTFALGAVNNIAGWSFDNEAIWLGNKVNSANSYTTSGITIGTNGMRGTHWFIDNDGAASFANGIVSFNTNSGTISGWTLTRDSLKSAYLSLLSTSSSAGIYISHTNISGAPSAAWRAAIQTGGGVYLCNDTTGVSLAGHTQDGKRIFYLSSVADSQIASWYFNDHALYRGTQKDTGFTQNAGDITLSSTGIRGHQWRLESDGSGALGGGKISWNTKGELTVSSDVVVSQLDTIPVNGGAHVEIAGSEINIYGLGGARNIRFGVDESGYVVLSYYDNYNNKLYDLGPNGLNSLKVVEESFLEVTHLSAAALQINSQEEFYNALKNGTTDPAFVEWCKSRTMPTYTPLWLYTARRINGTISNNTQAVDAGASDKHLYTDITEKPIQPTTHLAQGAFKEVSLDDIKVYTNLIKTNGEIPVEYTDQIEYYYTDKQIDILIDWEIDEQGLTEFALRWPVYCRTITIYRNGVAHEAFKYFWQNKTDK